MFHDFKRNFGRVAKRLQGAALTVDDLTTIHPFRKPGAKWKIWAARQYGSAFWKIEVDFGYRSGGGELSLPYPTLPKEYYKYDGRAGITLEEALQTLEEIEKTYAAELRGRTDFPYNHFSKVREMVEKERAAPPAPLAEMAEAITVGRPLELKKRNASGIHSRL